MTPPADGVSLSDDSLGNFESGSSLEDDYSQAILSYLREHGSATKEELLHGVCEISIEGCCTDHERVRVAVTLQTETLPTLYEAGLITEADDEVALGFLPAPVLDWIDSL